jgi:hypothetical protein
MNMVLQDGEYPTTLRDHDSQPLSTGMARLYMSQGRGVFWPQAPIIEDWMLKKATTVQTSDGHTLSLRKIERCLADWPPVAHYDFEFDA